VNFTLHFLPTYFEAPAFILRETFVYAVWYEDESKSKINFKLRDNRDREELAHCAVLTMPVEEFSHVQ